MSRDRPDAPPGSPLDKVYNALLAKGSTWGGGQDWTCPVAEHDDHRPSLGVGPGDKHAVVIKCGRCDTEDVVDALGLTMDDLKAPRPKSTRRRKVAWWDYTDEEGRKLYRIDRWEPKNFSQVAYDEDGKERTGRGAMKGVRRVLYKLPLVLDHCAKGRHIVITEGEKSAQAINAKAIKWTPGIGRPRATTAAGGAKAEWIPEYTDALAGAGLVTIIADRDEDGLRHAAEVYDALTGAGLAAVEVRQSATTNPKDDVVDHFAAGYGWGELVLLDPADLPRGVVRSTDADDKKRTAAERLMDIAEEAYRFTRSPNNSLYAVPTDGANLARPISSKGRGALGDELADLYWRRWGKVAGTTALNDALSVLRGKAMGLDPEHVALRVAQPDATTVVVDLGDESGRAVVVTSGGWEVVDRSPVLFSRTELTAAFPTPCPGGDLATLRAMLHVDDETFDYLVAWLVAAFIPEIPHAALMINGEFGTAKSYTSKLLGQLIDPASVQLRRAPTKADEWPASVAGSWCVALDNLSHIPDWLSDALCRAVTSEGSVKRTLYTDADIHVESFRRVLILNGIEVGGVRDDLADRLSVVDLLPIPPGARREEAALTAEFVAVWPGLFGALLDVLAAVLKVRQDGRDRLEVLPRLADFARVLRAVDVVRETGALPTYLERAETAARELAEEDPVSEAVVSFMLVARSSNWEGRAAELLVALDPPVPVPTGWPKNARTLASRLKRLSPGLRAAGWTVEQRRSNGDKLWFIEPARVGAGS